MSRFYGSIDGRAKTTATREGTSKSGIQAHIRGWNVGVEVRCFVDKDNHDVCEIFQTGGSNNPSSKAILTVVKAEGATQKRLR